MKHLCATFFFLCCILQGAAQTLHFILFTDTGNKLIDTNGAFRSFDGQITTGDTYTPTYKDSKMEDFELVIPYSELHVFPGWNTPIKFVVCITDSNNTPLAQSDYYSFTY